MLDEAAWSRAKSVPLQIPVTHATPISVTNGRVLWDDKNLYIGFRAYDKDIWGYLTTRDADVFNDDYLEVFFKTGTKETRYFDFEITPQNTVYDGYFT